MRSKAIQHRRGTAAVTLDFSIDIHSYACANFACSKCNLTAELGCYSVSSEQIGVFYNAVDCGSINHELERTGCVISNMPVVILRAIVFIVQFSVSFPQLQ